MSRHDGQVIGWSGPHPGCIHDAKLWELHPIPLPDGASIFGDAAYVGSAQCVPPFKRPAGGPLSYEQLRHNRAVQWYRSGIEHVFGAIKHFAILRDVFRGRLSNGDTGLKRITAAFTVLLHCLNAHVRVVPRRHLGDSTNRLLAVLTEMDTKHAAGEAVDGTTCARARPHMSVPPTRFSLSTCCCVCGTALVVRV